MTSLPYLNEHEASAPKTSTENYQPNEAELKAINLVKKLFSKCKNHRSLYDAHWMENYHMFRGKQWDKIRPTYKHSEVINLIFQNIQSMMPILTDMSPRISYLPEEPSDREVAEVLNDIAESDWTKNNWSMQLFEVILDARLYGAGHSSLKYDREKNYGVGGMCYKSEETVYIYPDPEARDVNLDCEYFFHLEPRDIDKLKAEHKDKAKYLKPDLADFIAMNKNDLEPIRYKSPSDNRTIMEGTQVENYAGKDKALLITLYLKDKATYDEETKNEAGETIYQQRLQYPKGRMIQIASGVVLKDEPCEYDHGEIPYQRFVNYILPREYWGISEVDNLKGPQKTFNKLISFALDVLTLCGAPVWVVDTTSGIDTDQMVTRPGMVLEKEPGSEVRTESGVQLQPWVLQLIDRYKEWFDQVGGSQDVTRGVSGGVTAASAITALQEAAQTRIRQQAKNLDAYLQSFANQYKSNVFQFYTVPQIFRLTNKQGLQKYFKFHIEKRPNEKGEEKNFAIKQDLNPDGTLGNRSEYEIRADFDVQSTMGSSLPFNKEQKKRELLDLYDRQIIDAEEVLTGIDYPNKEAVLERMNAKAEAQAAQASA